jgi:hypothetical protein
MEQLTQMYAAVAFAPILHKLNKGEPKLNKEKYPVLKTRKKTAEEWWDSLNKGKRFKLCGRFSFHTKIDVGHVAMHYHQMSANYKWNCTSDKFATLTKSQQRIVKFVFERKNDKYNMFDMVGMLGLR